MGRSRGQEVVPAEEIASEKGLWQERGGRLTGGNRKKAPGTASLSRGRERAGGARVQELCRQLMESGRGIPGQSHRDPTQRLLGVEL